MSAPRFITPSIFTRYGVSGMTQVAPDEIGDGKLLQLATSDLTNVIRHNWRSLQFGIDISLSFRFNGQGYSSVDHSLHSASSGTPAQLPDSETFPRHLVTRFAALNYEFSPQNQVTFFGEPITVGYGFDLEREELLPYVATPVVVVYWEPFSVYANTAPEGSPPHLIYAQAVRVTGEISISAGANNSGLMDGGWPSYDSLSTNLSLGGAGCDFSNPDPSLPVGAPQPGAGGIIVYKTEPPPLPPELYPGLLPNEFDLAVNAIVVRRWSNDPTSGGD